MHFQVPTLQRRARALKNGLKVLRVAHREGIVPWYVKLLIGAAVAYAFSPLDLIPDFIPVLGLVDDLIIVPALIWLILKLIPYDTMGYCRKEARQRELSTRRDPVAGGFVVVAWCIMTHWLVWMFWG